ncbi:hypothetical protein CAEBREN_01499 [Caenorhabditis brenneri]|uniref:Uncharacterized protein n=1 Tax=Caenorhabditis brenneri TaxID=135651 RepID=G0NI90_CAEBE|nr:hypothetical protein CAEBREN_01499 [Caenorhabditis brenneri]
MRSRISSSFLQIPTKNTKKEYPIFFSICLLEL